MYMSISRDTIQTSLSMSCSWPLFSQLGQLCIKFHELLVRLCDYAVLTIST